MLSTDHNKKIDKSFFAVVVRKMLITFGDSDWIVLHCLYFLQHKHPVYNCSGTAMSRPFPHSCEQRHQVESWVDKIQWFVWNCSPEPQPHFFMFGYWCGMWERSVRQESYDFCVSPSLLSFSHFSPELVGKIFGLFLSQKPGWNFSYEPKAKLVRVTGPHNYEDALKYIRSKYIKPYHHYQYQIKGWPNKTINKAYWERLFTLTATLLYLTPRNITGTSLVTLSKHV